MLDSLALLEIAMLRYILRRTGQMVVVVFGVVTLVFFLLRIASGDPARMMNPPGQHETHASHDPQRLCVMGGPAGSSQSMRMVAILTRGPNSGVTRREFFPIHPNPA